MTEQIAAHTEEEPNENQLRGNLNFEDALFVASDPKIKEHIDWASANTRVARMLSEGVAKGESAIPGIKQRAELARTALGVDKNGVPTSKKSFWGWVDKRAARRELEGQNYSMLIDDDRVASKPGYSSKNPYEDIDRRFMSPDELAKAEQQKAKEVSYVVGHTNTAIDERAQVLLDRKAGSIDVLRKLDSKRGRSDAQLELTTGESWPLVDNEKGAANIQATATSIVEMIRNTPGLQELVEKGMEDRSEEQ